MANSTSDYFSNTQLPFDGNLTVKSENQTPKKTTIEFILAYSKSLEFVKSSSSTKNIIAEVNLN